MTRPDSPLYNKVQIISHKDYPADLAEFELSRGRKKHFKVTIITRPIATLDDFLKSLESEKENDINVHKNQYDMTLAELIEWIRSTEEIWYDIIDIEPMH